MTFEHTPEQRAILRAGSVERGHVLTDREFDALMELHEAQLRRLWYGDPDAPKPRGILNASTRKP